MKYARQFFIHTVFATAFISLAPAALACSSCGCTLSADWDSQGYSVTPGLRIDLRYDYLDQSQLRSGKGSIDRGSIGLPADREIEQDTKNQYTTLGLDYSANRDWGFNLQIPYIHRTHSTIAEGDTDLSTSTTRHLGDVKVLTRYQGFVAEKNFGVQFGVKLPTGSFHDTFRSGPQADNPLDRGLQAGTGTTDVLFGLYHFATLSRNWDYFAQGMIQAPLAAREDFKPGNSLNINVGVRYMASEKIIPQLQLNARVVGKDSGDQADRDNSGGRLVYLSPGITVEISKQVKAFGFLQVPIYQYVNGYQLTPRTTFSLGLRYAM
ncbi:MAG: hypothetical protein EPO06_05925 [Burkholderiaceae bacterium]|nr:MAG: hypothetical protein EPO06_05925 [Burkholderiaceae bacterium]